MLPPEKDDGNIEYKRYISIKIDKELEELWNLDETNNIDSNSPSTPLLSKVKSEMNSKNSYNYNKTDSKTPFEEIQEYRINKCFKSNLRFNQLATQMKFRISEGEGIAIYYIGVNNDGTIYNLSKKEKSISLKILKEIVKFINCKIDKLLFIDSYLKVIIKDDKRFLNYKERRILLLGDTESGKTTFLAYLIKNIVDTKECKARLHILNHKHELESGRTSSFTYQYLNFNETKFVFIDTPGFEGDSINFKSSKKRNKLLLSINFDLIIFFDKPDRSWNKKNIYLKYALYNKIPFTSVNLFSNESFINLIKPVSQELILNYLYSLFNPFDKLELSRVSSMNNLFENEDDYIVYKRKEYKRKYFKPVSVDNSIHNSSSNDNLFLNNKSTFLDNYSGLSRLNFSLDDTNKFNKIYDLQSKTDSLNTKSIFFNSNKSTHTNLNFISSYPHQDIGLVLSGFLSDGELYMGMKLFCYIDFKMDLFKSIFSQNSLALDEIKKLNPIEVIIKSIHKDGENVEIIYAPSIITISIEYYQDFDKSKFNNDMLNLIRVKDFQINFISNYCYQNENKFKLFWIYSSKTNSDSSIQTNSEDESESMDSNSTHSLVNNEHIQIVVRNQIINLKKVSNDSSNDDFYYVVVLQSKTNSNDYYNLFNINNQFFFSEDSEFFGFGIIKKFS